MSVYKTSTFRVVKNILYGFFFAFLVGFLTTYFTQREMYGLVAAVIALLLYVLLVVVGNTMTVTVNGRTLTVTKGKKTKTYQLDQCRIGYQKSYDGVSTDYKLKVEQPDGEVDYIDCDVLGGMQFNRLLEDIGIGEFQNEATKLETKKGGDAQ